MFMPESEKESRPSKATLSAFIRENTTLVTALAAFVALTAFFTQLKDPEIQATLPGATLIGAVLIAFELFMNAPPPPRHWRLATFEVVLFALLASVGWYWLRTFSTLWAPLVTMFVVGGIFLGLSVALTFLTTKFVNGAAHLLRKDISHRQLMTLSRGLFLTFLFAIIFALTRGLTFRIHIPGWLARLSQ